MLEPVSAEAGAAGPPSAVLALLEAPRALAEYVSFVALARLLAVGREGHGRPVLVLPGLLADDRSTRPLRRLLNSAGYTAYGWRLGTNIGPTRRIINGMDAVLSEITDRHGEPASLIGWSLGGMLGYDIGCRRPAAVDRLITLGSPLYSTDPRQSRGSPFYDEYADGSLARILQRQLEAARRPIDAGDIHLQQDRWSRALANLLAPPGAAEGEHRGLRQSLWVGLSPGRRLCDPGPPGCSHPSVAQIRSARVACDSLSGATGPDARQPRERNRMTRKE